MIGVILIRFDSSDPSIYKQIKVFNSKLDIGNASLNILKGYDKQVGVFKELIVCYKTIFVNTFSVCS